MPKTTLNCPGGKKFNQPEIAGAKICQKCGRETEFFSDEFFRNCECGTIVAREIETNSCVFSCKLGDGENELPPCLINASIPEKTKEFIIKERRKTGL